MIVAAERGSEWKCRLLSELFWHTKMYTVGEAKRQIYIVARRWGLTNRNKIVSAQEDLEDFVMPEAERKRIEQWMQSSSAYQVLCRTVVRCTARLL